MKDFMKSFSNISISIVIPTYNRRDMLKKLLDDLSNLNTSHDEIIVINNSNNSQILNLFTNLRNKNLKIRYFKNKLERNQSYGRNLGIRYASNDIIAFLDDDCIVDKNWKTMVNLYATKYSNCILMGKNINAYSKKLASVVDDFRTRRFFEKSIHKKGNIFCADYLDTKNFVANKNLLMKNDLFFDEKLFYAEDVDLSMRITQKDIPIVYCPKMIVYHHGVTSILGLMKKEFIKGRARYILDSKWHLTAKKSIKTRLNVVNDLWNDRILKSHTWYRKLLYIIVTFFCSCFYKLGWHLERITNIRYYEDSSDK